MVVVVWVGVAGTAAGAGVDGAEEVEGALGAGGRYSYCCHCVLYNLRRLDGFWLFYIEVMGEALGGGELGGLWIGDGRCHLFVARGSALLAASGGGVGLEVRAFRGERWL